MTSHRQSSKSEAVEKDNEGPGAARDGGWWSRERVLILVLMAATILFCWLCFLLARPFLPAIAWAIALAVVTQPMFPWIQRRVGRPNVAAGICVALVAVLIVAPVIFLGQQLFREAAAFAEGIKTAPQQWENLAKEHPAVGQAINWLGSQENLTKHAESFLGSVPTLIGGTVATAVQLFVTFFILFFLYRDREHALHSLRSLLPLSSGEATQVSHRVADTIHATIYGTLLVAAIQGTLGGLMFWVLGLPAPLLWGVVMAVLAVVPVLGAFVVWMPAAIFLALQGEWWKAVVLAGWGTVVVGLIDNLLYPVFVGKRLRFHTVPVFLSIVGGLSVFGASGLILGPVILSVTSALIDIWRRRTSAGQSAEAGVKAPPARAAH
jgi:predicted PurR-regulated permease PerM